MYGKNIKKGIFKCKNPHKYNGNPDNIVYRSGLELKYFKYLDLNTNVLSWSSEEVIVPYIGLDGRRHRYFPDVYVKVKNKKGQIKECLCEIKPAAFLIEPRPQKRVTQKWKNSYQNWLTNKAKFEAAENFAKRVGWQFILLTDKDI